MKKLEVGVVGLGYWGPNVLRNFYQVDGARVRYACDLKESNCRKMAGAYPSIRVTRDYEDLLKDPLLDAVAVATPVSTHYALARAALEAGKHVLIEKPMTATIQQADELVRLAAKKKRILMVDHTFVYTGAVRKIKAMQDSGEIGTPFYFDSQRMNLGLIQQDVNVIWDLAPHDFSILEYLFGRKPVSVFATGGGFVGKPDLAEVAYITLQYEKRFFAHVAVSWLSPVKLRQIMLCGDKKMILYNDVEPTEKIRIYDKGVDVNWSRVTPFSPVYRSGDVHIPKLDMAEALKTEVEHFVDCVVHRRVPLTDGKSGRNVVALLEASSRSLREGKAVKLS